MHEWPKESLAHEVQEGISNAVVLEALRSEPDLSKCELYLRWRDQEEAKLDGSVRSNVEFVLCDARLRRTAGLLELAVLAYEEALETAELNNDTHLAEKIRQEMNR